jgi:N-glycosylase/DNA lyase
MESEDKDDYGDGGIQELMELYIPVKGQIESRLNEFHQIWETGSDEDLFREMVFCLLTPQSRARTCWAAVERLIERSLLAEGEACEVQELLIGVRFNERKADYLCLAREMFSKRSLRSTISSFNSPFIAREWLVQNVKGLGYKEASHFLRNIGLGKDLAILDRHILKNLRLMGVIDDAPKSLSKRIYLDIEKRMTAFSKRAGIPMDHLDLLLWYKEAGEIFK